MSRQKFSDRRTNGDEFACERVSIRQTHGAQRKVAAATTIKFIAKDRTTGASEMNTNLVLPAGVGTCFDKVFAAGVPCDAELRFRRLAAGVRDDSANLFRVGRKTEPACPRVLFGRSRRDCEINLLHAPRLKEVAECVQRSRTFGEQQNARGFRVEPVNVFQEFQIP